jgi:hypothetical protein
MAVTAEWLKAHAWKACLGEALAWVQNPTLSSITLVV